MILVTCDGSHRHRARRGQGARTLRETTDALSYSVLGGKKEYCDCFVALFVAWRTVDVFVARQNPFCVRVPMPHPNRVAEVIAHCRTQFER
jgi:hypothetical protein